MQGQVLTPLNRVSQSSLICLSVFFSSHCSVQAQTPSTRDSRFGSPNASVRHPARLSLCSPTSPVSLRPSNLQWPLSGKLLHISAKSYLIFQLPAWTSLLRKLPLTPTTRSGITSPHSHSILTSPSTDGGMDQTCLRVFLFRGLRLLSGQGPHPPLLYIKLRTQH